MKCIHCNCDLKRKISHQFEHFRVGQIECPKCNNKQKRYLSFSDLLLYTTINSLMSTLGFVFIIYLYHSYPMNLGLIVSIVLLFIIMYFVFKYSSYYIYEKAPFKQSIKHVVFHEDATEISKRLKFQLILFMMVSVSIGVNPDLLHIFFFLIFGFIVIYAFTIGHQLKKEYQESKDKHEA